MTTKYYTDEEIIERIINVGNGKDSYEWLANLVQQRFMQKDKQREHIAARLNEAANMIGHAAISENMQYE
jgi:disulfide oxidoreductase YuzD